MDIQLQVLMNTEFICNTTFAPEFEVSEGKDNGIGEEVVFKFEKN